MNASALPAADAATAAPPPSSAALAGRPVSTPLTRVSLAYVEHRIKLYLRFGEPARTLRLDRWRSVAMFLPNAMFCAYKGVGPNVIVNGTTCKRADGVAEVPLEALTAQQPRAIYVLLGTNVLGRDTDYSSFLTYYRLMLDMLSQTLPNAKIYVQSITPVRPEVCQKSGHEGLNRDRLCQINNELAAIALEKNCYFLNLWEVLADENGDLIESYAQPDGYHLRPAGYAVWTDYLCSHTEG